MHYVSDYFCSIDKDTVERTILTLKSLYPLSCDTDEKKRTYISAKMPFNIPNTVRLKTFVIIIFLSIKLFPVKRYRWPPTGYRRAMSSSIIRIWFSRRKYSGFTSIWSVSIKHIVDHGKMYFLFIRNAFMIVHPFTFR